MTTQESNLSNCLDALYQLKPQVLTVPQMERLLSALKGKESAYRDEIEARHQAEINRRALTGFSWGTL